MVKSPSLVLLGFVLAVVASGCVAGPCGFSWAPPHIRSEEDVYRGELGPLPDMSKARLVAKAHILARQHDAASVRIKWPSEFERETEMLNEDEVGPPHVSWTLTVEVTGRDESTGEERQTKSVFSYRHSALVKIVERSGDESFSPPVPLDELAAKAVAQGYALDPNEATIDGSR